MKYENQIATITVLAVIATLAIPLTPSIKASTPILGGIAHIQGVDDGNHTVIVISKNGTKAPEGPVIVVPPKPELKPEHPIVLPPGSNNNTNNGNEQNQSGEIITPPANETIIISPGGNITEIPGGNVTEIDNGTAIITDENRTITETPGNVTVIDPPQVTHPIVIPPKQNCTCQQQQNQSGSNNNGNIPPVVVTPAPGQNVTTNEPPHAAQLPVLPQEKPMPPLVPNGNQTNNTGNRPQQLPSNNNNNDNKHAQQLPVKINFNVPTETEIG
jgi:hypothetical protein